jgi:membrane-bound lytic murein transglycosylase A
VKAINYSEELAPGQMALRKIGPEEYPRFSIRQSNTADLLKSIDHSTQYLNRKSSQGFYPYLDITHDRAKATMAALKETIQSASPGLSDEEFSRAIADKFEVYRSIGGRDTETGSFTNQVLFTAYCTPIYDASATRSGPYQFPLYRRPTDLVSDPITGEVQGRKMEDGTVVPYYSRQQIEQEGVLAGQEIVWLKNKLDVYIITIQGSARLQMTDGQMLEIGYAGANGLDYVSPGERMIADGKITKDQLSLRGLKAYFAAHPDEQDHYLSLNPRYVFFAETRGGPYGSLNVPVINLASIATDKSVYPRAMPGFLVVPMEPVTGTTDPFHGFMMDQDTGGAIRAAGRTDIYMGVGPDAEVRAGQQLSAGQLYYVAVKPDLVATYLPQVHAGDDH